MRLSIIRRDDVELDFTFTDINGDPVNLTGCTVFFTVKRRRTDVDADALITEEETVFSAPATGVATLTLDRTQTDIPAGLYHFDVQLRDSANKISSSTVGTLRVTEDITIRIS